MPCYCGCRTVGNRVKWACTILALVSGIAIYANCLRSSVKNTAQYVGCMDTYKAEGLISQEEYDEYLLTIPGNSHTRVYMMGHTPNIYVNKCEDGFMDGVVMVGVFVWVAILMFILSSIPCCIMCCCTKPPQPAGYAEMHGFSGPSVELVTDYPANYWGKVGYVQGTPAADVNGIPIAQSKC